MDASLCEPAVPFVTGLHAQRYTSRSIQDISDALHLQVAKFKTAAAGVSEQHSQYNLLLLRRVEKALREVECNETIQTYRARFVEEVRARTSFAGMAAAALRSGVNATAWWRACETLRDKESILPPFDRYRQLRFKLYDRGWLALTLHSQRAIVWLVSLLSHLCDFFFHNELASERLLSKCQHLLPLLPARELHCKLGACTDDALCHVLMHVASEYGVCDELIDLLAAWNVSCSKCGRWLVHIQRVRPVHLSKAASAQWKRLNKQCAFRMAPLPPGSPTLAQVDDIATALVTVATQLCKGMWLQFAQEAMSRMVDRHIGSIMTRLWRPQGRLAQRRRASWCSAGVMCGNAPVATGDAARDEHAHRSKSERSRRSSAGTALRISGHNAGGAHNHASKATSAATSTAQPHDAADATCSAGTVSGKHYHYGASAQRNAGTAAKCAKPRRDAGSARMRAPRPPWR